MKACKQEVRAPHIILETALLQNNTTTFQNLKAISIVMEKHHHRNPFRQPVLQGIEVFAPGL